MARKAAQDKRHLPQQVNEELEASPRGRCAWQRARCGHRCGAGKAHADPRTINKPSPKATGTRQKKQVGKARPATGSGGDFGNWTGVPHGPAADCEGLPCPGGPGSSRTFCFL